MKNKLKLSPKQKEVMEILRNGKNHKFYWLGGLSPKCFISHNLDYKVSVSTALKLIQLGLVKPDDDKSLNKTLLLTELGQSIEL